MAFRLAMSRNAGDSKGYSLLLQRWAHAYAQPAPFDGVISQTPVSPQLVLPESNQFADIRNVGSEFSGFYVGTGSMELMAVPKRKDAIDASRSSFSSWIVEVTKAWMNRISGGSKILVDQTSPHKRGIRNGPKALKPVPVIVRCKVCGRVKLPHFFCCSGLRENLDSQE